VSQPHGRCIALCLCFLLIGIVIGGCIIAALPGRNRIHLIVMPNQAVNVSPEVGDLINWVAFEQRNPPAIKFSSATGRPCEGDKPASTSSTCQFNDSGEGMFIYSCRGSAICDPGIGPHSSTGGKKFTSFFSGITRILGAFVFAIDRALGFLPTPTATSPPAWVFARNAQSALLTAKSADYDVAVGCGADPKDPRTAVDPSPVTPILSGHPDISWGGNSKFTLVIDQSVCSGTTSTPNIIQTCKLVGGTVGVPSTYTVNDDSCTNQKTATATITPQ
jgi:hypothetical protein